MRASKTVTTAALGLLCAGMLLSGCGDDDDGDDASSGATTTTAAETTEAEGDLTAVCDAYVDVTKAFAGEPEGDPETFFQEEVVPHLEVLDAEAPEEIAEPLGVMTDAARSVVDSGGQDFSAFEDPSFAEAQGEVDPYMFDGCEFDATVEVTAEEYEFVGLPDELEGGETAFLLTNEGSESHEIGLARKLDGVTESFDEILNLPEEEVEGKVEFLGGAFAAETGSEGLLVADLTPGDYIAVCFIPVGTTPDQEGTGPPHFVEGMQQEFTVSG